MKVRVVKREGLSPNEIIRQLIEPRLRGLLLKHSPEGFERLISQDNGSELKKVLGLDSWFFQSLSLLEPQYYELVRACLRWLVSEIPSWYNNEYGEILKSERGRDWLRRGLLV